MDKSEYSINSFMIGLSLAISSSFFIGSSFIIKKVALKNASHGGNVRASAGGYSYLKEWIWWTGLITMGIGEAANLLAYAFAPAALVTPLGALSVLVAAVLSSKFLNEQLTITGKMGCMLCIIGSTIFVVHSPKSEDIQSFSELIYSLSHNNFITYVLIICVTSLVLVIAIVPKYGNTNIFVYLFICSGIGSLTVVFCKAIALGIKESITKGSDSLQNPMFWVLLFSSIMCIIIQMNYLNKSLDIFKTNIVTPVYYVMFTVLVISASGILFKEWEHIAVKDMLGCLFGFLIVVAAVFMLNAFNDSKRSFTSIPLYRKVAAGA